MFARMAAVSCCARNPTRFIDAPSERLLYWLLLYVLAFHDLGA